MLVQINADHNIQHDEALEAWVVGMVGMVAMVESALAHASGHFARVEIHLSDENGRKSGQRDKRCMMEARLEGRSPIAVTASAATSAGFCG